MKIDKKILLAPLMATSLSAFSGSYDGPQVDVDIIMHPPAKYDYCAKYVDSTVRVYRACEFGVDEASRMAQRYAGGWGQIDGFLQGYTWGLYKAATAFQNDEQEMKEGAALVDSLDEYLQVGIDAGISAGVTNGTQEAKQEVRKRFNMAVDSGVFPSAKIQLPTISYAGESNAYSKYVGNIPTIAQELSETAEDLEIYNAYDATYLSGVKVYTPGELWTFNGKYEFEKDKWDNPYRAFNVWVGLPLATHANFENLNVNAEIDPTTGALVVDYKGIFEDAFKKSYSYYVNYYYSINFHTEIETGQVTGEAMGIQVGKSVARTKGLAQAFDRKFKESSKLYYAESFEDAYTSAFKTEYDVYANNPQVSFQLQDVIGVIEDGVLQAGEEFKLVFKAVNVGGVGTTLNATISGDVVNGNAQSFSIRKLSSGTFVTNVIGKIDPRLKPREKATIRLTINGKTDSIGEMINNLVEIIGTSFEVDPVRGTGAIVVRTKNVSTVTAPFEAVAGLSVGGMEIQKAFGKVLVAGEIEALRLTFSNVDPLALIMDGVDMNVQISFGKNTVDQQSISIKSNDRDNDLVDYFVELINDRGVVPAGITKEGRLEKVRLVLKDLNFAETKRGKKATNDYAKAPQRTIIGKLVAAKKASGRSAEIVKQFDLMARLLYPARKNLNQFLFWGKKVDYDKLLKELSETGNLKDLK